MKQLISKTILIAMSIFAIIIFTQTGCKKDSTQTTATTNSFPIEGLWIGSYTVDGNTALGQQYYSYIIKPDGTMVYDSKGNGKQYISIGTWLLTGKTLSTTANNIYGDNGISLGVVQTSTSTWDSTGKLTGGIWKNLAPAIGQGTFTLTRVN
jgi:hypothetical protein